MIPLPFVAKTPPLPCVYTAIVAETLPLSCVHAAIVAEIPPFLADRRSPLEVLKETKKLREAREVPTHRRHCVQCWAAAPHCIAMQRVPAAAPPPPPPLRWSVTRHPLTHARRAVQEDIQAGGDGVIKAKGLWR